MCFERRRCSNGETELVDQIATNSYLYFQTNLHNISAPSSLSPHSHSFSYRLQSEFSSSGSERIDPSTESIPSLCNLDLNDRLRPGVIVATQFLSRLIGLEHILAVVGVGVLRPLQRTR